MGVLSESGIPDPIKTARWRSGRDSNPRYAFDVYSLSRRAPSTTRPPLRIAWKRGRLERVRRARASDCASAIALWQFAGDADPLSSPLRARRRPPPASRRPRPLRRPIARRRRTGGAIPDDELLVFTLANGRTVVDPARAARSRRCMSRNIRKLARAHWWDGDQRLPRAGQLRRAMGRCDREEAAARGRRRRTRRPNIEIARRRRRCALSRPDPLCRNAPGISRDGWPVAGDGKRAG